MVADNKTNKETSPYEEIKDDEEDIDEIEGSGEEFVVEAILEHRKDKSGYKYLIKWKGYSDEENTWEKESNILAQDLLDDYWKDKPRAREAGSKQRDSKKRKNGKSENSNLLAVTLDHGYPPKDLLDWEAEVVEVETIERNSDGNLVVYLAWKNGCHTSHEANEANIKCPQKVIEFYQNHLKFLDEDKNLV